MMETLKGKKVSIEEEERLFTETDVHEDDLH
jgi:hypothetical protein